MVFLRTPLLSLFIFTVKIEKEALVKSIQAKAHRYTYTQHIHIHTIHTHTQHTQHSPIQTNKQIYAHPCMHSIAQILPHTTAT